MPTKKLRHNSPPAMHEQKVHRKHTPLTSEAEQGLYGSAYGAKKAGKPKSDYVPASLWKESKAILKMHLEESKGKKLPEYVKKKK